MLSVTTCGATTLWLSKSNPRLLHSGATWQAQAGPGGKLFVPGSSGGLTDWGFAHQGPLIPLSDGRMLVLYFSEFTTSPPEPERAQVNGRRSVLHLRQGCSACNSRTG